MIGILAVSILALIAVQGTVAYRLDRTEKVENRFVFQANGLQATLTEPGWIAANARNIVPGSVIPKDPRINNTGVLDEWAAIKITFCYGPDAGANAGHPLSTSDLAKVLASITILWNSADWIRFDDATAMDTSVATAISQTFYYRAIVRAARPLDTPAVPAGSTSPLMSTITIKPTNTEAQMIELKAMGGFRIYVEGCVLQSEVTAAMTAATAHTNFTFANTPS